MNSCWAACLGNCSKKISREHIITAGLFVDDELKVKGLPWCLDDFKVIGISGLVKKALCTHHNSLLSDVDDAAIHSFKTLRDAISLTDARKLLKPQAWEVKYSSLDGSRLERRFLKTMLNSAFGEKFLIGRSSSQPGVPPRDLVEIAFRLEQFQYPAGLYLLGDDGEKWSEDGIRINTFGDGERHRGARFWFRGLDFMLLIDENVLSGPFSFTSMDGQETTRPTVRYHPRAINLSVHDKLSQVIRFSWDP
jgi:hypothetical protein